MDYNSDFRYDLEVGQVSEKALAEIFENKKVEVKRDLMARNTGNLFIEFESRGKPSGIATSESEYYAFDIGELFIILSKENLMSIVSPLMGTAAEVKGGDNNTSLGVLLPINKLIYQYNTTF
jgi:hypothetical protein|tara:strand:- start:1081 stop:1446 length:366 start_codon:yes stop_codon:yes gene_type:complete